MQRRYLRQGSVYGTMNALRAAATGDGAQQREVRLSGNHLAAFRRIFALTFQKSKP